MQICDVKLEGHFGNVHLTSLTGLEDTNCVRLEEQSPAETLRRSRRGSMLDGTTRSYVARLKIYIARQSGAI